MRVLVVDDDASIRLLCRVNLELRGYAVAEAATLVQARELLAGGGVHAVLLDLALGADDGLELLPELEGVPVALLTGRELPGAGLPVLEKPFELEELCSTVERLAGPAATGRLASG
jgi:DNA-binding response OmpR family regulator